MPGAILRDIDLVCFDKDGTLIDFHAMWSGWSERLADDLERATGRPVRGPLYEMLGYDATTRRAVVGGGLVSTPMARLREATAALLGAAGVPAAEVGVALGAAWRAPDPVATATPIVDLHRLLGSLRAAGRRLAVVTADDRAPTERTLAALGIADAIDAIRCADDGLASKPAPDTVLDLCRTLGVDPARTAVVGDSPADVAMGRAAGAGLVVGVRSGVGTDAHLAAADHVLDSVDDLID